MKIVIELVNGKVFGVYSDYDGEVEVNIYEDIDASKMTDEEIDILDNEVSTAPYILYRDKENQVEDLSMKKVFNTTDSELTKYNETEVEIIRPLTEKECDIEDVGNMYRVRFFDGCERDVFEDELS